MPEVKDQSKASENEIKRLRRRKAEIKSDLKAASSDLEAARAALVEGDVKVSEVQALEGRVSTLEAVLQDVSEQIKTLESEKERAERAAERDRIFRELSTFVGRAAAAKQRRNAAFRRAVDVLEKVVEDMAAASSDWDEAVRAFQEKASEVMPTPLQVRQARRRSLEHHGQKAQAMQEGLARVQALAENGVSVIYAAPHMRKPPYKDIVGLEPTTEVPDTPEALGALGDALQEGEKARMRA